ncbi:MAG: hypothetical protein OEY89_12515 [Gammaproteobacteria bacterium]|nr:hypothetical protein [Gammaproteobacteria bacterium]
MQKYAVILNGIVEADSANEAIQIFTETHNYDHIECFEYNNAHHPFDGNVTFQELIGKD